MKDQIDKDSKERFIQGGFSEGVGFDETANPPSSATVPDEELQANILQALESDMHVDTSNISVEVKYGEVTVTGTVTSRAMMNAARDCVAGISGVKKLNNELEIRIA